MYGYRHATLSLPGETDRNAAIARSAARLVAGVVLGRAVEMRRRNLIVF